MQINAPQFQTVEAARAHLEAVRWPEGRVCPHCGIVGHSYETSRPGKYRCAAKECRKDFSVTVGTIFERSHIPLHKWLLASYLLCSSKKGISSHQLHRMLSVTYKTAWFMTHRIREAMKGGSFSPIGGAGKTVEADETYIGRKRERAATRTSGKPFIKGGGAASRNAVVSLVERGGSVRSFHVQRADKETVTSIVARNVARESILNTDESRLYNDARNHVAEHHAVRHTAGEFVRGKVHSNTVEGYFSIFKRGMVGTYQHCGEQHLHRYLAEFDFRYNSRSITDSERMAVALRGIGGKRLMYKAT